MEEEHSKHEIYKFYIFLYLFISMEKERVKERIEHAKKAINPEYEVSFNEKGESVLKKKSEIKRGKKSRAAGARFELKTRKDLEEKGFTVDKWTNNVDLKEKKITPAKRKYNPFKRALTIGTGMPDFIALKRVGEHYEVRGIEVKRNGYLDKTEKEKCKFYLDQKTFSKILIAKEKKEGRKISVEYIDFEKKYLKKGKCNEPPKVKEEDTPLKDIKQNNFV